MGLSNVHRYARKLNKIKHRESKKRRQNMKRESKNIDGITFNKQKSIKCNENFNFLSHPVKKHPLTHHQVEDKFKNDYFY